MHLVSDLTQMRSESNISASASLTYDIFSANGSINYFTSDFFRSYFRYIKASARLINRTEYVIPSKLTETVRIILDGADGVAQFASRCGQSYIKAVHYGGSFAADIVAQTKTDESTVKHEAGLDVGIGELFGGSVKKSDAVQHMNKHATLLINIAHNGKASTLPSFDEVLSRISKFEKDEENAQTVVLIEIAPYNDLPQTAVNKLNRILADKIARISILADRRDRARMISSNLRFANSFPALYEPSRGTAYQDEQKAAEAYLLALYDVVAKCQTTDLEVCKKTIDDFLKVSEPTTTLGRKK